MVRRAERITDEFLSSLSLPQSYVFKGTHGSGMVMLVEKATVVTCVKHPCAPSEGGVAASLLASCRLWLAYNFSAVRDEPSYSTIPPGCMFEEAMQTTNPKTQTTSVPGQISVMVFHHTAVLLFVDGRTIGKRR